MSPLNGSSPNGSQGHTTPGGHFDSNRAKGKLAEVINQQDQGKLFQTSNLLAADSNYNKQHIN